MLCKYQRDTFQHLFIESWKFPEKAAEGEHEQTNGGDHVDADHEREDQEAAENIMERAEGDEHHDDSQDHLEPADEHHEDEGGGTAEGGLDFSTEGRGEGSF